MVLAKMGFLWHLSRFWVHFLAKTPQAHLTKPFNELVHNLLCLLHSYLCPPKFLSLSIYFLCSLPTLLTPVSLLSLPSYSHLFFWYAHPSYHALLLVHLLHYEHHTSSLNFLFFINLTLSFWNVPKCSSEQNQVLTVRTIPRVLVFCFICWITNTAAFCWLFNKVSWS